MKLEVGKYYRTCEGLKVGPAAQNEIGVWTAVAPDGVTVWGYCENGNFGQYTGRLPSGARRNAEILRDIAGEWVYETPPCVTQELADEPILDAASGQQKAEPAWKQDGGKPRLDLIAPEFLFGTAEVLRFGADKYAERNWEKGMSWGRCFGAMMRHMWAWWSGEATDKETGLSHLWHAACCLMFLIAYEQRKIGTDDRKNPVDNS